MKRTPAFLLALLSMLFLLAPITLAESIGENNAIPAVWGFDWNLDWEYEWEDDKLYFDADMYKVGADIPEGEYVLMAHYADRSAYFCVSSDANGDKIIFNGNFEVNSIVTVKNGEYLDLSRCDAMPIDLFYTYFILPLDEPGTMLRVGYDIEPGEYKLTVVGERKGYYCVYPDSRQDDILTNKNFDSSAYVTVKEGQYLELSRCIVKN